MAQNIAIVSSTSSRLTDTESTVADVERGGRGRSPTPSAEIRQDPRFKYIVTHENVANFNSENSGDTAVTTTASGAAAAGAGQLEAGAQRPAKPPVLESRLQLKNLHRILAQAEDEPLIIILFKWAIIVGGFGMLGIVVILMTEVVYDFFSGTESDWLGISYDPKANLTSEFNSIMDRINSTFQANSTWDDFKTEFNNEFNSLWDNSTMADDEGL